MPVWKKQNDKNGVIFFIGGSEYKIAETQYYLKIMYLQNTVIFLQ